MPHEGVLVVGAGPTGLNLALQLARRRVPLRLISDAAGPGEHSRAMVVQARTLEFYAQLGIADETVERGVRASAAHLLEQGRELLSFRFDDIGNGLSPFPFALAFAQDDHERFLIEALRAAGGEVEWRTRLTGLSQNGAGARATVARDGQTEEIAADYVCGCDGAHSRVREALGVGFPGGTYEQLFYVADVRISRDLAQDMYISLGQHDLALMFPVRSSGMRRLIGLVPPDLSQRTDLRFDDIRGHVEPLFDIRVTNLNWFSAYRVHHRVAERFQIGRSFLLGDAGHIHSPVGGQGMNTGIGDAVNLGWKLAQVQAGRADARLLDTYEPERIGFARELVATTDRAFTPITAAGFRGEVTRRVLAPLLFGIGTRLALPRHAIFRVVSQTRIHYSDSPLSQGKAGHIHGGDRLPWVRTADGDNFASLRSLDWQVHVYGNADSEFEQFCRRRALDLHVLPWSKVAQAAGFRRDATYLVRPDGHVALASPQPDVAKLEAFIARFGLSFGPA